MQQVLLLVTLFLISSSVHVDGQELFKREKRDNTWVLGYGDPQFIQHGRTIVDFNSSPPNVFREAPGLEMDITAAAMSNIHGSLLFYTNGLQIAARSHEIIEQGDSIMNGQFAEDAWENGLGYLLKQGVLILPYPGNDTSYLILHERMVWGGFTNGLYFTEAVSSGTGLRVTENKLIPIIEDSLAWGGLISVRHANGRDWWVLVPKEETNKYYRLLVSPQGIEILGFQEIGRAIDSGLCQNVYSPDGTKFVRYNGISLQDGSHIDLFDFDRCEGLLYNPKHISFNDSSWSGGAAISQ
ncbi:MAG: hypothetical protein H6560_11760, partial [Lewinellaceae bacterium]|nr:hypothetical protein [Lewinellaceae bacterium]